MRDRYDVATTRLRRGTRVTLAHPCFWAAQGTVIRIYKRSVAVQLDEGLTVICDRWQVASV